jgi:hypothetical protein
VQERSSAWATDQFEHRLRPEEHHQWIFELASAAQLTLAQTGVRDEVAVLVVGLRGDGNPAPMAPGDERGDREHLLAMMAAARAHGRQLAARISQLCGEIARTEDRVAVQRERMTATRPDRAHELRRSAEDARSFADHERREQQRWNHTAQKED